ncbi:MAG: MerC family mercury resistance protein [Verrucomicrobiota bacterium]
MSTLAIRTAPKWLDKDRIGVVFSVLCAIHCAVTPFLLLLTPAFGRIWSHPASHWLVALAVIPLAGFSIYQGFKKHRKAWIPIFGGVGILLIIVGAALPYFEGGSPAPAAAVAETEPAAEDSEPFVFVVGQDDVAEEEEFVFVVGQDDIAAETDADPECADSCCPSLYTDENGATRLNIPPASIVTTLGGLALILTHVGNLCSCAACGRSRLDAQPC